ncbi:MAG: hypothetical protein QXX41_05780 [Nitrososphaerota archaeon]
MGKSVRTVVMPLGASVVVRGVTPLAEQVTDTKSVTTTVSVPRLLIKSYAWPTSAVANTVLSGAFSLTVTAPDADVAGGFCGFVNKTGNPGAIEVNVPGVGWTSIAVGQRFTAGLGTILKGTEYTYGPRDLRFKAVGTYTIDLIAGVVY